MASQSAKVCTNLSAGVGEAVPLVAARHASPAQRAPPAVDKPLLYSMFSKCCFKIAAEEAKRKEGHVPAAPNSSLRSGDTAAASTTSPTSGALVGDAAGEGGAQGQPTSPFLCNVLQLNSAGFEPPRFSHRSGRQLSECEALHQKHGEEYHYLSRVLSETLRLVVASHSDLYQQQQALRVALEAAMGRDMQKGFPVLDAHEDEDVGVPTLSRSSGHAPTLFECFKTAEIPHITLSDYVARLVRYTYASPATFVIALLYLDRLLLMHDTLLLTEHIVFKLLTTSLRISSKMYDTRTLSNKDFAGFAGVTPDELALLETDFLTALHFELYVSAEEFNSYARDIILAAERGEVSSPRNSVPLAPGVKCGRRAARRVDSNSFVSRSGVSGYVLTTPAGPAPPPSTSTANISCGTALDEALRTPVTSDPSSGGGGAAAAAAGSFGDSSYANPHSHNNSITSDVNRRRASHGHTGVTSGGNAPVATRKPPKASNPAPKNASDGADPQIRHRTGIMGNGGVCGDRLGILENDTELINSKRCSLNA